MSSQQTSRFQPAGAGAQPPGRMMASALGSTMRYQHFVRNGARPWFDSDGWPMGLYASCGEQTMEADEHFLAQLAVCPACKAKHPDAVRRLV